MAQQLQKAVQCRMPTQAGPRCTRSTTNTTRDCGQHKDQETSIIDIHDGIFDDDGYQNNSVRLGADWADSLADIASDYMIEEGHDPRDMAAYQELALTHAFNIVENVSKSDLVTFLERPRGDGYNAINFPRGL